MSLFSDLQGYCRNLRDTHAKRDNMFMEMEHMYLLEWPEEGAMEKVDMVKITKDPDPRNAIQGAHRLLTVTEPKISVPYDKNRIEAIQVSEAMEKVGVAMLQSSGRISGRPVHFDAALAGLLYSEVQLQVKRTKDLYDQTEGASPAVRRRAKRIMEMTPYLFDVFNPRQGYPVWDAMGLREYHRVYSTTLDQLLSEWGADAERAARRLGMDHIEDRLKPITVSEYWDLTTRGVWVENDTRPVYLGDHELSNIPVVCTITEGSSLFDTPENSRQPFLITEYKSGMWNRKNLSLTVLFTTLANFGLAPLYVFRKGDANQVAPSIRQAGLIQYLELEPGADFAPLLNKGIMDPAAAQALEIAERKTEESTMYKSTLGGFLGSGTAYSTHAMLSQLGRIPLETTRRMVGWAIADALRIAFDWMRTDSRAGSYKAYANGVAEEIDVTVIPEFFEIECDLDVALPQDRLNQANVYNQLEGKVPARILVEDILGIGQYEEMAEELLSEQAFKVYSTAYLQQMVGMFQQAQSAQAQQAQQMQMMQAQAGAGQGQPAAGDMNSMVAGGNMSGQGVPTDLATQMAAGQQGPGAMAPPVEAGQQGGLM